MGTSNGLKQYQLGRQLTWRKLFPWTIYAIVPIALYRLYFSYLPSDQLLPTATDHVLVTSPVSPLPPPREEKRGDGTGSTASAAVACELSIGRWVYDERGPLYNGTSCATIKDGQNCMAHGRPDSGYLHWRWEPHQCHLPRFDPDTFLQLLSNKHLAFVGDSMARNQLESLLCMLSTVSRPQLLYTDGDDNKFRKWAFPAPHQLNVSVYWSPFLVKGVEKSSKGPDHNELFLDLVDERWASDLGSIDVVVFSVGHWLLHPAVYFEDDSVLGCHYCPGMNHTEIGFYDVLRKAVKKALGTVIKSSNGRPIDVFVTTFSPSHFEGDWDKFGACPRTEPYKEGEKVAEGMDAEMRRIVVEEVEAAREVSSGVSVEVLDVTGLALLRPDGHPGPYMYAFPFASGLNKDRPVQNDCVHWCLPGPIDTWNEMMLGLLGQRHGGGVRPN